MAFDWQPEEHSKLKKTLTGILRRTGLLQPAFQAYSILKTRNPRIRRGNARYRGQTPPDGIPIPPVRLIYLVSGSPDISWFLEGGRLAYRSLADALAGRGIRIESLRSVLDFGCGCGRVTRYWHSHKNTRVSGTDFNPSLIRWCRRHLPFARFTVNEPAPPLAYRGEEFDFIYALSVFTHLPEARQAAWMSELSRVLKPGGVILMTTHGEFYRDTLSRSEREEFTSGRVVVRYTEAAGTNLCSAYHPPEYVREILAGDLECIDFIPEGARGNPHQDIFLLRKPEAVSSRASVLPYSASSKVTLPFPSIRR